ncbi:MAG TPA: DUF5996 family protein [Thermoanaerobaculia bacterium]|nr:DUF5996 family protein [Thermoanaerobaculia bacterium]
MTTWPALPLDEWWETRDTLHRWTQILGKIRMELTPLVNHWWNVPLYMTPRGLTTSTIPYGDRWFDMELDFLADAMHIRVSDGGARDVALAPRSVADFHDEVFAALKVLQIGCRINPIPSECEDTIPLDKDTQHASYDREYVLRFWRIVALSTEVLTRFRARFVGKCSPVHFFWGSFDLAVTRFSGRRAPARPGVDPVTAEAYSHEVSSVGWWPGDHRLPRASFYSYAAPEPPGFRESRVSPAAAYYNEPLDGFYLHHDDVVSADDPAETLMQFCHSTYDAAADCGKWDRDLLERRS